MSKPYRDFEPKWYHGEVPPTSYRSIFKWGAPDQIKPPKESLYKLVKEKFGLTDADFGHYTENLGLDAVRFDLPCTMEQRRLDAFRDIVGAEYVRTDDYARLSVAYGKTMYDILRLRNQVVETYRTPCFIRIQRNRSSELWLTARRKRYRFMSMAAARPSHGAWSA